MCRQISLNEMKNRIIQNGFESDIEKFYKLQNKYLCSGGKLSNHGLLTLFKLVLPYLAVGESLVGILKRNITPETP